jgi:hypothetical protein
MLSPIYFLSAVSSVCAAYLLWSLAIREFLLDGVREKLFGLRFELFRLAMNGEIDFDNEAYRSLEILFCGLLRFAHRITFLTYVMSRVEAERAEKEKDYVNVSAQIALRISRLEPETRAKLLKILEEMRDALMVYIGLSSLFFFAVLIVYRALHLLGIRRLEEAKVKAVDVVSREAYLIESRRGLRLAAA